MGNLQIPLPLEPDLEHLLIIRISQTRRSAAEETGGVFPVQKKVGDDLGLGLRIQVPLPLRKTGIGPADRIVTLPPALRNHPRRRSQEKPRTNPVHTHKRIPRIERSTDSPLSPLHGTLRYPAVTTGRCTGDPTVHPATGTEDQKMLRRELPGKTGIFEIPVDTGLEGILSPDGIHLNVRHRYRRVRTATAQSIHSMINHSPTGTTGFVLASDPP
ncbi:hypothetical protein ACH4C2_37910, partial [Streptomyces sp. NPDC018057]|uniref:hypothetical protein n=1 Tax=Streptomyces sp. NPDC018057 TaxID=3365040 RepID=UPI00378DCC03